MIDQSVPIPRRALAWFAGEMERQLRKNDHKRGWEDETFWTLYDRAVHELNEVWDIIGARRGGPDTRAENFSNEQLQRIIEESSDVANFAMMIADNARRELERRIQEAREP